MAFSDELKNAQGVAAPEKQASTGAVTAKENKGKKFRDLGQASREGMNDDEKALEGSKSDTVEFIAVLMNPAKKASRTENKTSVPSHPVIGYKLRLLEDAMVPKAPLKSNNDLDVENITFVQAKAGDIVSLNIIETGAFISQIQYGGRFNGNGKSVVIGASFAQDREEARPVLSLEDAQGSIKTTAEFVADMVKGEDGRETAVVKDEFKETFGILFQKKSVGSKPTGAAKKTGESYKNLAAAFRAIYDKKTVK